jgi:hypothetical protein
MNPFDLFSISGPPGDKLALIEEIRGRHQLRVSTVYEPSNVQYLVDYPAELEDQSTYRYCCPICLKYFNHVLISDCCANYICRHCTELMLRKAIKDYESYTLRCAHCLNERFALRDVKLLDKIKYYTDTPMK